MEEVGAFYVMTDAQNENVGVERLIEDREELVRGGKTDVNVYRNLRLRMNGSIVDTLPAAMDDGADKVVAKFRCGAWYFADVMNGRLLNK